MRLVKIPITALGDHGPWINDQKKIRRILDEYGLQERVDYKLHYMSGSREFHILLNDGKESVASMLALRFVHEV